MYFIQELSAISNISQEKLEETDSEDELSNEDFGMFTCRQEFCMIKSELRK